ncbi:MAG: ribosomal protein S18-alanine N-acetyltransferase [Parvularculaceae bacterium]|nr:ribosomal protein S18-alanine N-acetyltransferase [Parvularculaceae bacterium]
MSGWTIRTAARSDEPTIVKLEALAFGCASWGEKAVADGLNAPKVSALLIFPSGEKAAIGFAFWRSLGEDAEILSIGVTPRARRRGAARELLSHIIERARETGMRRLFLEVDKANCGALALYRLENFEKIGERRRYYKNGGDALVMRLDL